MKKLYLCIICTFGLITGLYANNTSKTVSYNDGIIYTQEFIENLSEIDLSDEDIEEIWYKEKIPKEYSDAFLYYTRKRKSIRMNFYSIMVHESNNFTVYVNKNKDGSFDYGPSQLNSKNFKNKKFQKWYRPKDESHITTKYCYFMVETINFYWDLYNKYGEDYAYFAYNGGEATIVYKKQGIKHNTQLMKNVHRYDESVRKIVDKNQTDLDQFKNNVREAHIAKLQKNLNYTFCHYDSSFINNIINPKDQIQILAIGHSGQNKPEQPFTKNLFDDRKNKILMALINRDYFFSNIFC